MNKIKIFTIISLILFLTSCQSFSLKQDKNEEFLVKKKSPLIMPPDYNELPIPKSENTENNKDNNEIKKLITNSDNNLEESSNTENTNKQLEDSLIEMIKNN
tara:strand:- start:726 stop:1031 length:306 start_codon:yes stop_codon:yes gene_type:complete